MGVVGLGIMGLRHATALGALDGCEYVGAADHGEPHRALGRPVVPGLADLLAVGMDACVVATPAPDHLGTATALAEAGIPTLVEKPLAMSAEQCAQVTVAFSSAGVLCAVGHVERFHPAVRALQAELADGRLGPVVRVATWREGGPPRRRDTDMFLDLGTHDFDLTRWLTGLTHEQVTTRSTDTGPDGLVEVAEVVGTLSNGAAVTHALSWRSAGRKRRIEVHCADGVLSADTTDHGGDPPVPSQLRAFRDVVLGRLDPTDAGACASLGDAAYAVDVAARAAASWSRSNPR